MLIPDVNGNYAFVYSTFVKIQTSTGPNKDTIKIGIVASKIGPVAFKAPALATGAQGGFHVLILKRTTINQIGNVAPRCSTVLHTVIRQKIP